MNRKDKRAQESKKRRNLRVINGGKVDRAVLAKAVARNESDNMPPPQKFAEAVGVFLAAFDQHEQELPENRRCSETDKLAILMRVCCNRAIKMEVPYEQFLDGVAMVYEEQEKQLADD